MNKFPKDEDSVDRSLRDERLSAAALNEVEYSIYRGGYVTASHYGLYTTTRDERFMNAMDGSISNKYFVDDVAVVEGRVNVWVQWASIDNDPVIYNRLFIHTGYNVNLRPTELYVMASHDGETWDMLWTAFSISLPLGDTYFSFFNDMAYPIYRIYMGHPISQGIEVRELSLSWTSFDQWSTNNTIFTASHGGYQSGRYDERYIYAFDGNTRTKFTHLMEILELNLQCLVLRLVRERRLYGFRCRGMKEDVMYITTFLYMPEIKLIVVLLILQFLHQMTAIIGLL